MWVSRIAAGFKAVEEQLNEVDRIICLFRIPRHEPALTVPPTE
jgi:hypothetical protein